MSYNTNQAREIIYAAFIAAWGTTTPVALDNEAYDPVAGRSWVRVAVRHTASRQDTMGPVGNRQFTRLGIISVQVYSPADSGTQVGDNLAQAARAVYEGRDLGPDFTCREGVVMEKPKDGLWLPFTVEVRFEYLEVK